MKFLSIASRPYWLEEFAELEYMEEVLNNLDEPYWVETLSNPFYGAFSLAEIDDVIWQATKDLQQMSLETVDWVCNSSDSEEAMDNLSIPPEFRSLIRQSWQRQEPSLYGRFDFAFDTKCDQIKLLEYNADTPTSLYESSILQWLWFEDHRHKGLFHQDYDQYNSLHEQLIERFGQLNLTPLHFASVKNCPEDYASVRYLQLCAIEAGISTHFVFMEDIGCDEDGDWFDLDNQLITNIFKLYPWEDLMIEDLQIKQPTLYRLIAEEKISFLEPIWKAILSNKGILPIFWQLFQNHPVYGKYLLEAYGENYYRPEIEYLQLKPHVKKPLFGREGQNIHIIDPEKRIPLTQREGEYGDEGYIIQDYIQLAQYEDFSIIMGSWVVGDEPCGISLRGDRTLITSDRAIFIPHLIKNPN